METTRFTAAEGAAWPPGISMNVRARGSEDFNPRVVRAHRSQRCVTGDEWGCERLGECHVGGVVGS